MSPLAPQLQQTPASAPSLSRSASFQNGAWFAHIRTAACRYVDWAFARFMPRIKQGTSAAAIAAAEAGGRDLASAPDQIAAEACTRATPKNGKPDQSPCKRSCSSDRFPDIHWYRTTPSVGFLTKIEASNSFSDGRLP